MRNKPLFPSAIASALLLLAGVVAAPRSAMAQDAAAFIQNLGTQGIQALGPGTAPAQRVARFRQLFDSDFDVQGITRFVAGPSGRNMTPEQQQEFAGLFRDYVAQTYAEKLGPYGGAPFRVTGTRQNGDETIVISEVQRQGNPAVLEWHVANRGRPLVTDVHVNGSSMRVSERDQLAAILQRNGGRPDSLLSFMRQQVARAQHENGRAGQPAQGSAGRSAMPPDGAVGSSTPPQGTMERPVAPPPQGAGDAMPPRE